MCDPVTIAIAGAAALSAYGQYQAAEAAADAEEYNAEIQEQNARIADQYAELEIERGKAEEAQVRRNTARLMGDQEAALAAKGVDLSVGTPVEILADTAEFGELDAKTTRYNARVRAYDRQIDAYNSRAGAALSRSSAKNTRAGGRIAAVGTLIGGASQAGGYWKQYGGGAGQGLYDTRVGSQGASSSTFRNGTTVNWR